MADFERLSRERLDDARALLAEKRYDGGVYLCGYAVEMALKCRICKTLKWNVYPARGEYRSFYTHNLDVLLTLTGVEADVRSTLIGEWSIVNEWDPEKRYTALGAVESDLR